MSSAPVFQAKNAHFAKDCEEAMAKHGLAVATGCRFNVLQPGHVEIEMPHNPLVTQHHGAYHGGIISFLADNAGGFAAQTLMAPGRLPVASGLEMHFLELALGPKLIAAGRVVKPGKTLTRTSVQIFTEDDRGHRKLVAIATQTSLAYDATPKQ